jgi:hypothetical protein
MPAVVLLVCFVMKLTSCILLISIGMRDIVKLLYNNNLILNMPTCTIPFYFVHCFAFCLSTMFLASNIIGIE